LNTSAPTVAAEARESGAMLALNASGLPAKHCPTSANPMQLAALSHPVLIADASATKTPEVCECTPAESRRRQAVRPAAKDDRRRMAQGTKIL